MASDSLEVVSVEQDGRVLSGVGADADALRETMDRHTPDETPATEAAPVAETAPTSQEPPKLARGRQRYSELTKARDEANARAEAAEREREELKAKLAAVPARSEQATPIAQAPAPVARPAATREKPTEDQVGSKYPSYADFVEDLADWKAEQRLAALDWDKRIREQVSNSFAEQEETRKLHARSIEVATRGRAAYKDYDATLNAPHLQENWPGDKFQVLASLDNVEHILYQLGKDPALHNSLLQEPNLAKFGMRVQQLMTAVPVASQASTGPASFVPPPPMQPVGSGSKTTVPPSAELAKHGFNFDKSGYRERRAAERGVIRKVK